MSEIKFYKPGGDNRPTNHFKQKIWLKLYSIPFLNKSKIIKNNCAKPLIYLIAQV